MKKIKKGLFWGAMVGLLDVMPMIFLRLDWKADFSAFFHWLLIGFLVATIDIKMRGVYKGLLLAVLTLVPIAFLVWGSDSGSVIPMLISTIIFGGLLGFLIQRELPACKGGDESQIPHLPV